MASRGRRAGGGRRTGGGSGVGGLGAGAGGRSGEDVGSVLGTVLGLDGLIVTSKVSVDVFVTTVAVIGDGDGLDPHLEWGIGEVGQTASPFDGTGRLGRGSSVPASQLDAHWGLWEVLAIKGVAVVELAYLHFVDAPADVVLGPVDRVIVELVLRLRHVVVEGTVVGSRVTLSEVVGLNVVGITSNPFLRKSAKFSYSGFSSKVSL